MRDSRLSARACALAAAALWFAASLSAGAQRAGYDQRDRQPDRIERLRGSGLHRNDQSLRGLPQQARRHSRAPRPLRALRRSVEPADGRTARQPDPRAASEPDLRARPNGDVQCDGAIDVEWAGRLVLFAGPEPGRRRLRVRRVSSAGKHRTGYGAFHALEGCAPDRDDLDHRRQRTSDGKGHL